MTDSQILPKPPVAARRPHRVEHHGMAFEDDWAWLRDPGYPEVKDADVLAYLEAENQWFDHHMAAQKPFIDRLYAEMRGRIKEADRSVPQKDGDWLYWVEYEEGAEYKKWYRCPADGNPEDPAQVSCILDEVELAGERDYFRLGAFSVSPCGKLLAYAVDDNGSERFEARIKNLQTGELMPDRIPDTLSSLVWSRDSGSIVYARANAQWRTDNARVHRLGTDASEDVEIFHEDDEGFRTSVGMTSSEKYILISTSDHVTSEVWFLPADDPLAEPRLVSERKQGREYSVEEHDGRFYIVTNDAHVNFRLVTAPVDAPDRWSELIAGSDDFYLTDMTAFRDFYVIEGRLAGLDRIEVRYYDDPARVEPIEFPEQSYTAGLDDNPEYHQDKLRLSYASMVSPATVYDYDASGQSLETLKVQEIPSGYDASQYVTERLEIAARDGTAIPVSIMYRKDREAAGPLHLYGYGAYGIAIPPGFSTTRLSLVDRGFAFAIAHIRGGDDLGYQWYLDGKLEKRTNTFTDFIDVARGLVDAGYTKAGRITISGGSAGGELMGVAVNDAPDLFGAVVAHVPFVDVLNTMLDASLPLTPGEWPEWGNPIEDRAAYEMIASYSPYDNVKAQYYPPMMVTAGLNDPRVTYWEPAKWVARLRATKADDNLLILKTHMGAGHGGKSGRWESLRETAEEYGFILWQMGRAE